MEAVLESTRIALPLQQVERVVRAAALLAVPGARGCLLGALDVAGRLISVYDTRRLLGLPTRPMRPSDCIVIASQPGQCALVVDDVLGTLPAAGLESLQGFGMHLSGVRGVARTSAGTFLVQDLRRLLALERAIPIARHA